MKIHQIPGVAGTYHKTAARKAAGQQGTAPAGKSDSVQLSREAQEAHALREKGATTPEIRWERVAELKRQIETGTYRSEAREVAERMLRARVFDDEG